MITIITGKINSGKTTTISLRYKSDSLGDGILSKKIMIEDKVYGFHGLRLANNFEFLFMIHEQFANHNPDNDEVFDIAYDIGPYHVLKNALQYIDETYEFILSNQISPVYFDEVGMLELQDKGFAKYVQRALQQDCDVVMTVRKDLVSKIVKKFHIEQYDLIK